ncbi:MAG: S8 family serine peptidase [Acidobacteria bacterium]|nr:S8 family serine peptidase [Acidobacteriota bacterium]
MAETISLEPGEVGSAQAAGGRVCSVCGRGRQDSVSIDTLDEELRAIIAANAPSGRVLSQVCPRCVELFRRAQVQLHSDAVVFEQGGRVLPTYLRMGAHNELSQTVERAVGEGLTVVCAVGNAGTAPGHPVLPPASSPSVIAVGGLDDQNSLDRARRGMYRSSYGPTPDGLQKPEIIAPGIWIAAPILPHTPTAAEAELYAKLDRAADAELKPMIEAHSDVDRDLTGSLDLPVPLLRHLISIKLHEADVISESYKYVDGTSFSAPIVSSIAACMLEANPELTPQQIKRILIDTSERLPGIEIDRQGWGVVNAGRAVEVALALRPVAT